MRRTILFCIMAGLIVMALRLLDWAPTVIEKDWVRRYMTIEDARTSLGLGRVYLPSYFPQYLEWPPREVFARKRPSAAVLLHVMRRDSSDVALAISQSGAASDDALRSRIEPERISQKEDISLKGRQAVLSYGLCSDGGPCNSVAWQEDGYLFRVTARDSVKELLKVSESMLSR